MGEGEERVMSQQRHIPVWDLQRDCYVCPADGCGETFSDSGRAGDHAQAMSERVRVEDGGPERGPWGIPMDDERESERDEQRAEERARGRERD
jgi:hypothetical protein